MSTLSFRDRELVALGAALASNCIPCVEFHVAESRKAGLADSEINEAIELADKIRKVPATKVLNVASSLLAGTPAATSSAGCAPAPAGKPACC